MANAGERVTVPRELVDWLEAANLFRQVGMPDRMELAVSRAGRLFPGGVIAGEPDFQERAGTDRPDVSAPEPMFETMNRIMAQSLGD